MLDAFEDVQEARLWKLKPVRNDWQIDCDTSPPFLYLFDIAIFL